MKWNFAFFIGDIGICSGDQKDLDDVDLFQGRGQQKWRNSLALQIKSYQTTGKLVWYCFTRQLVDIRSFGNEKLDHIRISFGDGVV